MNYLTSSPGSPPLPPGMAADKCIISTKRTVQSLIQGGVFLNSCCVAFLLQRLGIVNYARGIWKRSFISTVRFTVHTNPSRKWRFSKTLLKPKEFENTSFFVVVWKENILKTEPFENEGMGKHMSFPDRVFLKQKSKITGDCCEFKFLRIGSVNWSRSV